jgi:AraC-like DNA-binding protein
MTALSIMIPPDALSIGFISAGECQQTPDGWVLQKIVPAIVIAQVLFGSYEITCNGRTEIIHPGEAYLTPANHTMTTIHHGDPNHGGWMGARWVHLHYTLFDTLDLTSLMDLPLRIPVEPASRLGLIIQELVDMEKSPAHVIGGLARRNELAFAALRIICDIAPLRPESEAILQYTGRLASVFAYIHDHLAEPIPVAQLARLTHMSASRFHAFFRQHIGCTPMNYIKKIRLNEACKNLMSNDDSIAHIAERLGFCSQFHFSREFKAYFKMTPSQYRQSSSRSNYEETEISSTL